MEKKAELTQKKVDPPVEKKKSDKTYPTSKKPVLETISVRKASNREPQKPKKTDKTDREQVLD